MATGTDNAADGHARRRPRDPKRPPRRRAEAPLTPMIDVTFLLLLFFLLTFVFRPLEGKLPGSLPGTGGDREPPRIERPLRITLRPTGRDRTGAVYEVDGHGPLIRTPRELARVLERQAALDGAEKRPVVIMPRGDVQWRWAVEAFNQSVRAKFEKIGFAPAM
jgi:biopolymer transport protein ExbD